MRDLFPGWVPPDEKTLDRYWNEATFAVDTSVLLDLYRFSEEARRDLLKALRSLEERLWVPYQVAFEFHRNRFGVLLDQREAETRLLQELDQIRQAVDGQLSKLLRGAGRRDLAPLSEAIDDGFQGLGAKLREAEQEHTKGLGESLREDPIYEEVVALCAERLGAPFDDRRQAEVIKDAEVRLREERPPGYLDTDKEGDAKYGDVVLWHQLCQKAQETKKPVVLIADDQKADWVWEVRGKTIGPRPELVAEMKEKANVGFHLYTPFRFLEVWGEKEEGREVEPEVLAEIESSRGEATKPYLVQAFLDSYQKATESLEKNSEGLVIPYLKSLDQRPNASHSIREDGVELRLDYPAQQSAWRTPRVTVQDPQGKSARVSPRSATFENPGYGFAFIVRYPDQFDGVEGLLPGQYEVIWEEISAHQRENEVVAVAEQIATDTFTVSVFEA